MISESATPAPTRRRWRSLRLWLLVALLAACGYGTWRAYAFQEAIKEAESLGWSWRYDDPIKAVRDHWRAAFQKKTWFEGRRDVEIPQGTEFESQARVLRRLAPKSLAVAWRSDLKDLSALEGLGSLEWLYIHDCNALTNVNSLAELSRLRELELIGCIGLTNVDSIKQLSSLEVLHLSGCGLTNLDALKGLSTLRKLHLVGCRG